jgi:hypothetical protein
MKKVAHSPTAWVIGLVSVAALGAGTLVFLQRGSVDSPGPLPSAPPASSLASKESASSAPPAASTATSGDPGPSLLSGVSIAAVGARTDAAPAAAPGPTSPSTPAAPEKPEQSRVPPPEATGSLPGPALPSNALTFSVARKGNEVTLSGKMPEPVRDLLLAELRSVLPGTTATDQTESAGQGALSPESRAAAQFALARLADLEDGTVDLRAGQIRLTGQAKDKQALRATIAALQAPPAGLKVQSPALTAVPISPFRFSARREPGALVLSGYVPSDEAREEIRREIGERFFHERVVDETRLADGAPAKFTTGARFVLDQLSQLASGEATVTGNALKVAGETLYPEAADRMRQTVKAPPAGWKGVAEIKVREGD